MIIVECRKILVNGEVTKDDINQLYMAWKPVCQGCRVHTKDNPNCFCGLIPPLNGSRKSGLWQKTSEIVNSLGHDQSEDLRESFKHPLASRISLHSSTKAFVNPAPFIQTLELDNGVQQDSHEFLTLLLSLLERCLSRSKDVKARTIVQVLFRGRVSHMTKCSKCGNESVAS
ncbi:Ubiquitin carboxyl-terminal hydrolase 26 [Abeliophyllum distichum]|uniref:ubiquitinyl hydrolase 1 n=1 Tax=Abeliophyllum distichum TaxID=126358 RepID=A0ABD1SG75_9LAMI